MKILNRKTFNSERNCLTVTSIIFLECIIEILILTNFSEEKVMRIR